MALRQIEQWSASTLATIAIAAGILALGGAAGCGDDGASDPDGGTDTEDVEVVETDPWEVGEESNAWEVLYNYRYRVPPAGEAAENELWKMAADGEDALKLTDLAGLKDLDPPLSCSYGCIPSPDLKWLAVVTGPPTEDGFEIKLGRFTDDLEVKILKGGVLQGIIDFQFAGDRIFYSKKKTCSGASCSYEYFVVELQDNVNVGLSFLEFPKGSGLTGSTYRGSFTVSDDGTQLVMLNTTIRSVAVTLWRDGVGEIELDFLCKFGTKDDCSGTGSEYSDDDPVAISPDGRYIVFFTFGDRWQRARLYDTQNPADVQTTVIASVPAGSYIQHACDTGVLAPWQWQRVYRNPEFTADGQEIVFLTETRCTEDGSQPKKPRTNLRRIKLTTLLEGRTLVEEDVFNITNNPFGNVTTNQRITGFDLSTDGNTVVFSSSPIMTQAGDSIPDSSARQTNDRELFRVKRDGTNLQQLTNSVSWKAESPMVIPVRQ